MPWVTISNLYEDFFLSFVCVPENCFVSFLLPQIRTFPLDPDQWQLAFGQVLEIEVYVAPSYGSVCQLNLGQIPASFIFYYYYCNWNPYLSNWHHFTRDHCVGHFGELLARIRLFIWEVPQNKRGKNFIEEIVLFVKKRDYFNIGNISLLYFVD